jgi:hypothetical protein
MTRQEFAYPKNRPSYFGFKVIRLMAKVRAADQIGTSGLAMVSVIAMQEDACGYKRAVSFWNEPLMLDLGMRARNTFNRTREACIEAGWLKYKSGGTRKVGYYYVSIPDEFLDEKDSAIDERLSSNFERNEELMRDQSGTNKGLIRDQCGTNEELMRDQCDTVSTLYPIPIPNPTPNPSKKKIKEKPKHDESFETFWTKTNFPKRPQDTKGDIKKKYLACIKAGLTPEDILFASDVFAEVNQGNQFSIGLRKFMEVETVREYLTENVKLKVDSKPMSKADRTMQAMNEMLREIDEREENKDDEDDDLQLAGF